MYILKNGKIEIYEDVSSGTGKTKNDYFTNIKTIIKNFENKHIDKEPINSTENEDKLFLIGSDSQSDSSYTYSNSNVYEINGELHSDKLTVEKNIKAGTGVEITSGNLDVKNGNIYASNGQVLSKTISTTGTITSGNGINITSGNLVVSSGDIQASGKIIGDGSGLTNISIDALPETLKSAFSYIGSVKNETQLNKITSSNKFYKITNGSVSVKTSESDGFFEIRTGDVVNVWSGSTESDGMNYAWNGSSWDKLGYSENAETATSLQKQSISATTDLNSVMSSGFYYISASSQDVSVYSGELHRPIFSNAFMEVFSFKNDSSSTFVVQIFYEGSTANLNRTWKRTYYHIADPSWSEWKLIPNETVDSNSFNTISVTNGTTTTNIVANSNDDTLKFIAGSNITLVPNKTNDSITISANTSGDGSTGGLTTEQVQGQILNYLTENSYAKESDIIPFDDSELQTAINNLNNNVSSILENIESLNSSVSDLQDKTADSELKKIMAQYYNGVLANDKTNITQTEAYEWNGNAQTLNSKFPIFDKANKVTAIKDVSTDYKLMDDTAYKYLSASGKVTNGFSSATQYYQSFSYQYYEKSGDTYINKGTTTGTNMPIPTDSNHMSGGTILEFGEKIPVFAIITGLKSGGGVRTSDEEIYATCDWNILNSNLGRYISSWKNDAGEFVYAWEKYINSTTKKVNYRLRIFETTNVSNDTNVNALLSSDLNVGTGFTLLKPAVNENGNPYKCLFFFTQGKAASSITPSF